ncbi:uncharacterized protein LOC119517538 [Choloepus didactylus]|uniref:uncharacterized protein LOC119517538 n=1 Tax=Choloepus didactylus TaxID=27675 RepID=UPI00189D17F5|nr:uncharacterized protein LOC119517538 [Choloepus didactylus]
MLMPKTHLRPFKSYCQGMGSRHSPDVFTSSHVQSYCLDQPYFSLLLCLTSTMGFSTGLKDFSLLSDNLRYILILIGICPRLSYSLTSRFTCLAFLWTLHWTCTCSDVRINRRHQRSKESHALCLAEILASVSTCGPAAIRLTSKVLLLRPAQTRPSPTDMLEGPCRVAQACTSGADEKPDSTPALELLAEIKFYIKFCKGGSSSSDFTLVLQRYS